MYLYICSIYRYALFIGISCPIFYYIDLSLVFFLRPHGVSCFSCKELPKFFTIIFT